jgi:serine/threonine protein kinase
MLDVMTPVSAAPTALEPGTMVGEYCVETTLGHGGMATVYGAVHPLIGKRAAIKVMTPSLSADAAAVARFVQEARAVNGIGHPNLVDVFSFGRLPDGRSYFVMEWLRGETLYERMWRGALPLPDVLHILEQICDGLEAAHDKGVIHRDLKPANVFLTPVRGRPDEVKLLDFGVAKLMHRDSSPRWTSAGCVVGTPEYISPEQARGRDVDARTDLYALGVIAYEMVLGRLPFISDNPADAIRMNLCVNPPRPSILWKQIPPPLEALLLSLLAKRADERGTLADVRSTLAILRPTATPALSRVDAAPPPLMKLRGRRHLVRLAALAVTFLMLSWFGYRPMPSHAQKLHAAPVTARVPKERAATATAMATASATAARKAAPTGHKRRHRRDGDYLLDPFSR